MFYFDVNSTDNVYYTVENGQVVKRVTTYLKYKAEATTVIYTKVELESAQGGNTSLTANADDESAPLYDLTGRKAAAQPRPGIYVRNGKKITGK